MSRKATCSKCLGENDRLPHRYCRACHARYMRGWNKARRKELKLLREWRAMAEVRG